MVPHDMTLSPMPMPPGDRDSAIFLSGSRPRHMRLGYLIQRRFPGLLKKWWMHAPARQAHLANRLEKARGLLRNSQAVAEAMAMVRGRQVGDLVTFVRRKARGDNLRRIARAARVYALREKRDAIEDEMFGREVEALRASAALHPEPIDDPNAAERIAELQALGPYFIIAFGGPLLRGQLLKCARGVAINQHAGWSPDLKGSSTTETALYHRQIGWVGNTVHLMDTFADSGSILRRTTAALHPDDTISHCFMAVVAVGSKMMLEAIDTALHADTLPTFVQPSGGQTVLNIDFTPAKRDAIRRDFSSGWLADALRIAQTF